MIAVLTSFLVLVLAFSSYGEIRSGEEWVGIYLDGKKIGYGFNRVEKTEGGYSITEETDTTLTVMGTKQEVRTSTVSDHDASLGLKSFRFSMAAGVVGTNITGSVVGDSMKLEIETMGNVQKQEVRLNERPHLSGDIGPYLILQGLEAGKKISLPLFDPATMSIQPMEVTVEAREDMKLGGRLVPAYRVREDFAGITARSWISPETGTLKGEGPLGMTFLRETKEQAMGTPPGGYQSVDLIALTSIRAGGISVVDPRQTKYFRVRLSGTDLSGLDVPGGRQDIKNGVLSVQTEDIGALKPVTLPVRLSDVASYLTPEPFVQSDDQHIVAKAKEITNGETDALKAARKICDWVSRSMEKKNSAGIPNAAEVLKNLSGDCNEHTALFTALARAAGIPARMNGGIVMMDGRFYYHAWPEVYVGGWVGIDPTFGQFPADATHIRLVQGGLDRYVDVLRLVGNLRVEVLEYK
jgi:hypothetical protein